MSPSEQFVYVYVVHLCLTQVLSQGAFLSNMDTFSCYVSVKSYSVDLIRPDLKDEYKKEKHKWFPIDHTI